MMSTKNDFMHLIPDTWHGLLTSKQPDFNSCGIEGAERWLSEMGGLGGSNHGDRTLFPSAAPQGKMAPDWFGLLSALITMEDRPTGQEGAAGSNTLSQGLCRFFRLPVRLQRTLLGLISHHASEIPLPLLQKLTRCIQDGGLADHWALFHLHGLQNHIATYLPKPRRKMSKVEPMTTGFMSESSKGLFIDVCELAAAAQKNRQGDPGIGGDAGIRMSSDAASSGFQFFSEHFKNCYSEGGIPTEEEGNGTELAFPRSTTSKVANGQNQAKHSFDPPADHYHHSELDRHNKPPKRLKQESDGDIGDNTLVQPPPVFDDHVLDRLMEEPELPEGGESNRVKGIAGGGHVDDVLKMEEKTVDAEEGRSFIKELSPDNKMQLDELKSAWHSEGSTAHRELCNEALKFMATCTSAQLCEVCDYIETCHIDIAALPAVCQSINPLANMFGYTAASILAKKLFLDKLTSLTQRAPRALNSALVDFTRAFPKPSIEGALAPCIVHPEASSIQYDLISKVAKEGLVNDQRAHLLRNVLVCSALIWSELVSGFVQSLLDMKLEMDPSLLGLLSASLGQNGTSQSKCKKFAKLLLAVINKYNKQITADHMVNLQRSVEVNQTFLKKACQAALKKIKA